MNEKGGETTKRVFAVFLTAALLLGLLSVGAGAAETKYAPLTLTNFNATVTIDKARVIDRPEDKTFNIFYGVPADAKVTVTVTGAREGRNLYIGAHFDKGSVNTDGSVTGERSAWCVLSADNMLQRVYLTDRSGNMLEEDNSWLDAPDYIRQNGTYGFTVNAADYVGWGMSLLCGWAGWTTGHFSTRKFVEMMDAANYQENDPETLVGLIVEKADGTASPATAVTPTAGTFADVAANSYCYDAVQWAVKQGITTGKTANAFAPNQICTKAQILTFLWRANGKPEPAAANPFTDVSERDYFYRAALWAAERGLASGSIFDAPSPCTRAMTVEYLWTLAGKPAAEKSAAFTDVPASAAYAGAVAWAVEKGITTGKAADVFAPDAVCTRGQIAVFLYRAME